MAITNADVKFKVALTNNDTNGNGGPISAVDVTASLFPNVNGDERIAGLTRYRKVFAKNEENAVGLVDLTLFNVRAFLKEISPAEDSFKIHSGTEYDTQDDADGYASGWFGVGTLDSNVLLGATAIDVACEIASGFASPGLVRISDGTNTQFVALSNVSWASTVATLTVAATAYAFARYYDQKTATAGLVGDLIIGSNIAAWTTNEHAGRLVRIVSGTGAGQIRRVASNTATTITVTYAWGTTPVAGSSVFEIIKTYVSQAVELGDIVGSSNTWVETTSAGVYNEGTYPLQLYPVGTVSESWTITFNNPATTYDVVGGEYLGTVVTGQAIGSDCKPANPSGGYYFNLRAAGFSGTWAAGDTITFNTVASAKSFWLRETVPALANANGDNTWYFGATGDAA